MEIGLVTMKLGASGGVWNGADTRANYCPPTQKFTGKAGQNMVIYAPHKIVCSYYCFCNRFVYCMFVCCEQINLFVR
jgi:hypothetical protein